MERPGHAQALAGGSGRKGFSARINWPRCRRSSTPRKATLFDVLAHVAYALAPLTREERATLAKVVISRRFNSKQQAFLDFVLSHYVAVAWTSSIRRTSPAAAPEIPGLNRRRRGRPRPPRRDRQVFSGFQKYLYEQVRRDQLHRFHTNYPIVAGHRSSRLLK